MSIFILNLLKFIIKGKKSRSFRSYEPWIFPAKNLKLGREEPN